MKKSILFIVGFILFSTSFAQKLMFENNHSYYNCSNYNIDYDCERNNCKINNVKGFLSNTKTCVSK